MPHPNIDINKMIADAARYGVTIKEVKRSSIQDALQAFDAIRDKTEKGGGKKFKKGSPEARAHMASLRARRGKSGSAKSDKTRGKAKPRDEKERDPKREAARDQTKSRATKRSGSRSKLQREDDDTPAETGKGLLED